MDAENSRRTNEDENANEWSPLVNEPKRREVRFAAGSYGHAETSPLIRKNSGNITNVTSTEMSTRHNNVFVGSPRSTRRTWKKPSTESRVKLLEIRTTEMLEALEAPSLKMPEVPPGLVSNAHLRTEAYWNELLGDDLKVYPCEWSTSNYFQTLVCVTIVTNAILLNMDASSVWWHVLIKHCILLFSVVELFIVFHRWKAGCAFVTNESIFFITLECLGVMCVCIDLWILPFASLGLEDMGFLRPGVTSDSQGLDLSSVLRMLWLLRFVHVIALVPQLHELVHALVDALQGLFWVFFFMTLFLYALAILCTRLIGHIELTTELEKAYEVQQDFANVARSMFTLFMIMSSWSLQPLMPAMEHDAYLRVAFILFYIFAGWTLLAVMTGTVSFHMMMSKGTEDDEEMEIERKQRLKEVLDGIFKMLDEDGNGELCYEEFQVMLQSKDLLRILATESTINPRDLEDMWEWLDEDGQDCVKIEDFMESFTFLNEPLTQKSVFRMQHKVGEEAKKIKARIKALVKTTMDSLSSAMKAPIEKLIPTIEQAQIRNGSMKALCERMDVPPGGFSGVVQVLELPTSPKLGSSTARKKSARLNRSDSQIGTQRPSQEVTAITARQESPAVQDETMHIQTLEDLQSTIETKINGILNRVSRFKYVSGVGML